MDSLDKLGDSIFELAFAIDRIGAVLERAFPIDEPPPQPGPFSIVVTGEEFLTRGEMIVDLIKFKVQVPSEATGDVVKREVSVTLADGSVLTGDVAGRDAAESDEFKGEQSSTVSVSVVNVDDAGNKSVPRVAAFVLADTVAPPERGEIGITVTGEETV